MDVVPGCGFLRPVGATPGDHESCTSEAVTSIEWVTGIAIPACEEHSHGRVTVGNWGKPEHDHHDHHIGPI